MLSAPAPRVVTSATLTDTQHLLDWGGESDMAEIITYAVPGRVEVRIRRTAGDGQPSYRLSLADLDTLIATLRTARKIVAKR